MRLSEEAERYLANDPLVREILRYLKPEDQVLLATWYQGGVRDQRDLVENFGQLTWQELTPMTMQITPLFSVSFRIWGYDGTPIYSGDDAVRARKSVQILEELGVLQTNTVGQAGLVGTRHILYYALKGEWGSDNLLHPIPSYRGRVLQAVRE